VPEDERQRRLIELTIEDVQIGAADAAGADAEQYLPWPGLRPRELDQAQRPARLLELHGAHRPILVSSELVRNAD
jgi:hypothetical protein